MHDNDKRSPKVFTIDANRSKGEGWNSNKKTVVVNADRHLINSRRRDSSKQIEVNILKKKTKLFFIFEHSKEIDLKFIRLVVA